jgi:hypothetical protein
MQRAAGTWMPSSILRDPVQKTLLNSSGLLDEKLQFE